jgi:hypothetical protein
MESTVTLPAWLVETFDKAEEAFEREAHQLRRRLYRDALTETVLTHLPTGLPELDWNASRWSDGTVHVWATPKTNIICLFDDEIRASAADFAAWLTALDGPAMTEQESFTGSQLMFEARRQVAGIDFYLCFRPWVTQVDAAKVRQITAAAIAAASRAVAV